MRAVPSSIGVLIVGRNRPGFDQQWGKQIEADIAEALNAPLHAHDEASLRSAVEQLQQRGCRSLVVCQPTMGDGSLAPVLANLWPDPLVLWATPERPDSDRVSTCSLVGQHLFASTLRQLRHPFELVIGHPRDRNTLDALTEAVRVTTAATQLGRATVGQIGSHAPGFVNMAHDAALMAQQLGVRTQPFDLSQFIESVRQTDPSAATADVAKVEAMNVPRDGVDAGDVVMSSRYYLALRQLLEHDRLDALALRCWPELPDELGQWPYLAMARLATKGEVVALEGDVDGAVTCLIGELLGIGCGYITDWLEHDDHTITAWHPGHAPFGMCEADSLQLSRQFNNDKPIVVNAVLTADRPVTLARF